MALNLPKRDQYRFAGTLDQTPNGTLVSLLDLLARYVTEGRRTHRQKGLCAWVARGGTDVKSSAYLQDEPCALHIVLGLFGWGWASSGTIFGDDGWNPERQYIAERAALYVRGTLLLRGVPLSPMPHLDDIARGMNLPHFQDITSDEGFDLMEVSALPTMPERVLPPLKQLDPATLAPQPPAAGTQAARVLRALQEGRNTLGRIAACANPCTETSASARIRELRSRGYTITLSKFRVFGTRSYHYTYTLED